MRTGISRDHDQLRFEPVYDEFHGRIERYVSRLVDPADVQDVTQEVFSKVSQALPRFRGDSWRTDGFSDSPRRGCRVGFRDGPCT